MSLIRNIHHVAYRCRDAAETVGFYREVLGMEFTIAVAEDFVPSTHEPDPYMHVFLDAGGGMRQRDIDLLGRQRGSGLGRQGQGQGEGCRDSNYACQVKPLYILYECHSLGNTEVIDRCGTGWKQKSDFRF